MTLAVLATLIAVAAPAFGNLIQRTEAQTSRSALTTALNTARIFAASKTAHVVVCPSADRQYCGHTTEWQHGWLIFIDADDDGCATPARNSSASREAQPDGVAILSTTGRTRIDYRPDGSATGSNVTFTVCDRRGSEDATALGHQQRRPRPQRPGNRCRRRGLRADSRPASRLTNRGLTKPLLDARRAAQDNSRLARIAQPVRASDC